MNCSAVTQSHSNTDMIKSTAPSITAVLFSYNRNPGAKLQFSFTKNKTEPQPGVWSNQTFRTAAPFCEIYEHRSTSRLSLTSFVAGSLCIIYLFENLKVLFFRSFDRVRRIAYMLR